MNLTGIKRSTYVLFVGIVVFAICWIAAVLIDGTWVFGVNTMSELGISDSSAKYLFLIGCVEAGICLIIYGAMMVRKTKSLLPRVVYYIFQVAGFSLAGVGVFTMDNSMHGFFTILFFTLTGISVIIYAIYAISQKDHLLSLISTGIVVTSVILIVFTPIAFVEPIFVILFMIWVLILDTSLYYCKTTV